MSKKDKINLIALIILVGFCISIYFSFVVYDLYLNHHFWSNVGIFFDPNDHFNDFQHALLNPNIKDLEPYELSGRSMINAYFPFTYILFRPFVFLNELEGLLIFFLTFILGSFFANRYFLENKDANDNKIDLTRNIFIFSFLSYPFLFTIDRANIEGWLFLMYAGFLVFYEKKMYKSAAITIGTAAAIKFYPGMFAFFFLKDKKYKEFSLFAVFAATTTLLSLLIFKGSLMENINGLIANIHISETAFAIGLKEAPTSMAHLIKITSEQISSNQPMYGIDAYLAGVKTSSTLLAFIKIILLFFDTENTISTNSIFYWYKISSTIVGLALFVYLLKFENEKWKIATFLASYFTLFLYTGFVYKLLVFFVPIWLFINCKNKSRYDFTYTILLALIMVSKHFTISKLGYRFDSTGLINPILMLTICALMIIEKIQKHDRQKTA